MLSISNNIVIFCNDAVDWGCCHMFCSSRAHRLKTFRLCKCYEQVCASLATDLEFSFAFVFTWRKKNRTVAISMHTINVRLASDYLLVKYIISESLTIVIHSINTPMHRLV